MKKIIILSVSFLLLLNLTMCKKPDNPIYDVLDQKSHGAALRTVNLESSIFNNFDDNSEFVVTVEELDQEKGDLLDKVNVYLSFIDKTDDGINNSKDEILLTSIPKSDFTTNSNGLPQISFNYSFIDARNALGIQDGEYFGGDTFKFRFEVVLTDGRTFSEDDAGSTIQGEFFHSVYAYYVNIVCIPITPITGDYRLVMHDSYGDGWQGSKIVVTIDGTATEYFLPDLWTAGLGGDVGDPIYVQGEEIITVPNGAQSLRWEFIAGDYPSEVSFEIYGPTSGNIIYQDGPSPTEGELFLNYCNE